MDEVKKLNNTKHLCNIYEQIKTAKNFTAQKYLSCIMGMWAHKYRLTLKSNPFLSIDGDEKTIILSRYWNDGFFASKYAMENIA